MSLNIKKPLNIKIHLNLRISQSLEMSLDIKIPPNVRIPLNTKNSFKYKNISEYKNCNFVPYQPQSILASACSIVKKEILFCKFCRICKNNFFNRTTSVVTSEVIR